MKNKLYKTPKLLINFKLVLLPKKTKLPLKRETQLLETYIYIAQSLNKTRPGSTLESCGQ